MGHQSLHDATVGLEVLIELLGGSRDLLEVLTNVTIRVYVDRLFRMPQVGYGHVGIRRCGRFHGKRSGRSLELRILSRDLALMKFDSQIVGARGRNRFPRFYEAFTVLRPGFRFRSVRSLKNYGRRIVIGGSSRNPWVDEGVASRIQIFFIFELAYITNTTRPSNDRFWSISNYRGSPII